MVKSLFMIISLQILHREVWEVPILRLRDCVPNILCIILYWNHIKLLSGTVPKQALKIASQSKDDVPSSQLHLVSYLLSTLLLVLFSMGL